MTHEEKKYGLKLFAPTNILYYIFNTNCFLSIHPHVHSPTVLLPTKSNGPQLQ